MGSTLHVFVLFSGGQHVCMCGPEFSPPPQSSQRGTRHRSITFGKNLFDWSLFRLALGTIYNDARGKSPGLLYIRVLIDTASSRKQRLSYYCLRGGGGGAVGAHRTNFFFFYNIRSRVWAANAPRAIRDDGNNSLFAAWLPSPLLLVPSQGVQLYNNSSICSPSSIRKINKYKTLLYDIVLKNK